MSLQPAAGTRAQHAGDNGRLRSASQLLVDAPVLAFAKTVIEYLARGVEFAAALIIAIAAVRATIQSLRLLFTGDAPPEAKVAVRLTLGRWLAVALEFELAADVLNTAVTPTWADIEKLIAIAALRTALNYFLEKEIREESRSDQRAAEANLHATQQLAQGAPRQGVS